MNWERIRHYILPISLGLLGLSLLLRVFLANGFVLVPEEVDVVVLVTLLSVAMIAAVHTIVRISMDHLRRRSVQSVRRETMAEHRRFLSRLDHELKNPLTALRAGLQTLRLTQLDAQQLQILDTMETETLRLSRLVTDLRKLADLETQPLNLQLVDLEEFTNKMLQLEHERFAGEQRTLTSKVDLAQSHWLIDEDLLTLAVHNLLDNAFKYTRPGDTITLEVVANQELTLRVSDTGIGMPEEAVSHIWEELYRARQLDGIPGSGIGLALVKAIVERHEGMVEVESKSGEGTTVILRLPALSRT